MWTSSFLNHKFGNFIWVGPRCKGLCCIWQAVCQVLKDHCTFSTMSPNTFTSLPTKTCACSVMSNSLQPHRLLLARLLCPWDSPDKNTGAACHFLLKGIFPTQKLNLSLLWLMHYQVDSLPLSHLGSLWTVLLFSRSVVSSSFHPHGMQVSLSFTIFCSLLKLMSIEAVQPSHPLSSPSPPALNFPQHQGLFKWVSSLHQVAKVILLNSNFESR